MYKSWTKRFARKIWKSPLALAVTAGILAGAGFMPSAFAADKADGTLSFDSVITGTTADTEYIENSGLAYTEYGQIGGVQTSTYIFNWDKGDLAQKVVLPGIHVNSQYKMAGVTVRNGAELHVLDGINAYLHSELGVTADKIVITAKDREGVFADGATINLNGDVTINATGDTGKGLVAYLDSIKGEGNNSGTYSPAKLNVNGAVNVESSGHAVQASGADINISGLANIHSTDGIAVRAMAYRAYATDSYSLEKMASVNIIGGSIKADKYDAIHNEGSNVYLNSDGANSLVVEGNVVMMDRNGHTANTIMKLTDDQSSWTGGLFTTNYNEALTIDQANNMQLTLQNGGTWNNVGESFETVQGDEALSSFDYTSTVASLTGGTSSATAGLIFQDTSRDLTINNYSGYTKVFYTHANDGTTISDFTGGDIIVKSAAEGAQIDIITDKHDISLNNSYQINTVLNNLAQKLVYGGAVIAYDEETGEALKAEDNLSGRAVIAEGLTNSSAYVALNKISFDTETGRGYLGDYISQLVTEFTTPLTGVAANDQVYSDAYVLQESGDYRFTKDSSITVSGKDASAIALEKNPATIIAGGTTLTLNVNDGTGDAVGIKNTTEGSTQIRADKININVNSANKAYGIFQTAGDNVIDGDLDIAVESTAAAGAFEYDIGVYANAGSLTINGDVNVELVNNGIGWEYYGSHGLYATSKAGATPGADIVVNGKYTFKGEGSGLTANMGGASITVDSVDIAINKDNERGYAAIRGEDGTVNVNVARDESGAIIGGAGNAVNIKGNVGLGDGAVNSVDEKGTKSALNLALNTAASTLEGVVFNQYGTDGIVPSGSDLRFTGDTNLWLQNGATWTNEQYGSLDEPNNDGMEYAGSLVSNFVGGNDIYTAGNIFQNDSNPLTINNYSGITKVYYAHSEDGTASEHYAAGDTIVNHAANGSQIYMLTDNSNITVEDRIQVNKVLNALAGKLVYTGFVAGEDDLQGMVGIAEGLTTYSNIKVVKGITFNEADGRGSYENAEGAAGIFNSAITGTASDEEYLVAGVTRDYLDYNFDPL
ncbi:MAG: beta strand repeat-containing protein, partial [Phascolarctobacterium sp.]